MGNVYVFLADGFEEIEAITPIDFLRRAGINVVTVGITGSTVKGAHNIFVSADVDGAGFVLPADAEMVVLPGGGTGTQNLQASRVVKHALQQAAKRNIYIAAICAAPTVLHTYGLLTNKQVTAFPTVQAQLTSSIVTGKPVEIEGKIITARSAGVALQFAYALSSLLAGQNKTDEVYKNLYPEI